MKKLTLSDTRLLKWFEEIPYFPRMARVRFAHLRQFRLKVRLLLQEYERCWVRIRGISGLSRWSCLEWNRIKES
jgi:hypothetical protein